MSEEKAKALTTADMKAKILERMEGESPDGVLALAKAYGELADAERTEVMNLNDLRYYSNGISPYPATGMALTTAGFTNQV